MPESVKRIALHASVCAVLATIGVASVAATVLAQVPEAGRGYELVSPPDKNGGEITPQSPRSRAATDGNAATFASLTAFAAARGTGVATEYMSERDGRPNTQGWSVHAITPPQDPLLLFALTAFAEPVYVDELSPDLGTGIVRAWSPLTDTPDVANLENLYVRRDLRSSGDGTYSLVTDCPACGGTPVTWNGTRGALPFPAGASADFRHALFESNRNLTGDGEDVVKLYASDDGHVRLAGVIPPDPYTSCGSTGPACIVPPGNGASMAGLGASSLRFLPRVISDDGSRAIFSAPVSGSGLLLTDGLPSNRTRLYQRDAHGTLTTADDTTVQINISERDTPASPDAAVYQTASTDGSRVFFVSNEALTDSAAEEGTARLYLWDRDHANDEQQQLTVGATGGTFTLTFGGQTTGPLAFDAAPTAVESALNALGTIGGAGGSVDVTSGPGDAGGSTPYLITFGGTFAGTDRETAIADGTLLTGGTASAVVTPWVKGGGHLTLIDQDREPGDPVSTTQGVIGASEDGHYVYFVSLGQLVAGKPLLTPSFGRGLYVWHDGVVRYIGSLAASSVDWEAIMPAGDGNGLSWGGGDLGSRTTPDGRQMIFRATDGAGLAGNDHSTTGCGDSGTGSCAEYYVYSADLDSLACATCNPSGAPATADAIISVATDNGAMSGSSHLSRALSDDGRRVFFSTREALVPQDVNGRQDAYEYDVPNRTVRLVSSGKGSFNSYFMDASASGDDVFFLTREQLVGWDTDAAYDLYDARVGGGFPEPIQPPLECRGTGCQGPVGGVPTGVTAGSATFAGDGNAHRHATRKPKRCSRGRVRRNIHGRSRCVKRKKRHARGTHRVHRTAVERGI